MGVSTLNHDAKKEKEKIEERNAFRFRRLQRFAEQWILQNLQEHGEKLSFIHSIQRPQDYLDFLSLILLGQRHHREDYYQLQDINEKIEKLITYLPHQESPHQGPVSYLKGLDKH